MYSGSQSSIWQGIADAWCTNGKRCTVKLRCDRPCVAVLPLTFHLKSTACVVMVGQCLLHMRVSHICTWTFGGLRFIFADDCLDA